MRSLKHIIKNIAQKVMPKSSFGRRFYDLKCFAVGFFSFKFFEFIINFEGTTLCPKMVEHWVHSIYKMLQVPKCPLSLPTALACTPCIKKIQHQSNEFRPPPPRGGGRFTPSYILHTRALWTYLVGAYLPTISILDPIFCRTLFLRFSLVTLPRAQNETLKSIGNVAMRKPLSSTMVCGDGVLSLGVLIFCPKNQRASQNTL
jgi:hypothetical protein